MGLADRQTPASHEPLVPVRDRVAVVTSIVLLLIAAVAWADVIRSSLGTPDMMMTMLMPLTMSDGLALVASWAAMMTAMMLPSALPMIGLRTVWSTPPRASGSTSRPTGARGCW